MSKILLISSGLEDSQKYVEPYMTRLNAYLKKRGAIVDIRTTASFDEGTFFYYDQVVFVFMNIIDSVPSSTLELFDRLENQKKNNQEIYTFVVCDEYESEKCDHSRKIFERWCQKENLIYKGSFQLGSGLMIMRTVRRFELAAMIDRFASRIIKHQNVLMNFTLFSLSHFIKIANQYWQKEIKKKNKEKMKMNQE